MHKEMFKDTKVTEYIEDPILECLAIFCKMSGRPYSKESLIAGLPIAEGRNTPILFSKFSSKSLFSRAASKAGFKTRVLKSKIEDINPLVLPCIVLLNGKLPEDELRACILLGFDDEMANARILLPEAEDSESSVSIEELKKYYFGFSILLKRELRFDDKQTAVGGVKESHWLWGTMNIVRSTYRDVIIASFLINLFVLVTPLFTMNVYDRVLPNNAIETLWALFIGISIVMFFDLLLKILRSHFLGIANKRADTIMSNKIFNHLLNIKLDAKPASTGQFVSRLQSFESVREFFTSATIAAMVDLPFVIIFILVIVFIAGPLAYITVFTVILSLLISWYLQRPLKDIISKSVKEEQIKQTTLIETVSGLEIIKSVKAQNRMKTHWDNSITKTVHFADKAHFLSQTVNYLTAFLSQFSNIAIVAGGVYLAKDGEITMGAIIASMILNGRVIAPISQLVGMIIKFDRTMLSLNNLDEVMKMPVEKENKSYISRPNLKGDIELKDVQFAYKDQNHQTLKDINLLIKQGEKVAILGKIGSGKSTLLKMIMNLYEPTKGSVLIDGLDTRQIDPTDLRHAIGSVPQEPFLFMGTIKDNLTIGEQYVSDEELLRVSKIAGLDDFLGKHEAGYDLLVGERGEGLSGGERQSVTLARALISDPNIIMLDEPTNSMDRQTEKAFINRLQNIVTDKTLIVVTHKTSLLQLVDRIIIVDNGQIIVDGPKDEVFTTKIG